MESLAVKYRPKTFEDVIGQDSIVRILNRQIELGEFKNCYLFCGPSGCGKTTIARIFANKINGGIGNPIEIDAASNNGVENVKNIVAEASERSVSSKYKIYIIDECVSGDTDILTDSGWKRIDSIGVGDKIAQYHNDGTIDFISDWEYVKKPYTGKMYNVSLRNGRRNVLMSPHHVQPLRMRKSGKIVEHYISDCKFAQSNRLITAGRGVGDNSHLTSLERLYIACQADGHFSHKTQQWEVKLSKPNKISRLEELLHDCNIRYHKYESNHPEDSFSIRFKAEFPHEKKLSQFFSLEMGYDRALDFIGEILLWDGSVKSGYPGYYSCTDKDNVDFVSAILPLCGCSGTVNCINSTDQNHRDVWSVNWFNGDDRPGSAVSKSVIDNFSGYIYCVKVPSKMIVLRAEGFTFISGNCHSLTSQAWQAFLKCIEEPPAFTIFMFATTDPQKIPATILNRCMRFNIQKISNPQIKKRLDFICNLEGFRNYYEVTDLISKMCKNQCRDAIALLDKVAAYSKDFDIKLAESIIGGIPNKDLFDLTNAIIDDNEASALSIIDSFYNSGVDMKLFVDVYLTFILDVVKFTLFTSISMTNFSNYDIDALKKCTNFKDSSKYFCWLADRILNLKNILKTDTSYLNTVEVAILQMCRLI